MKKNPVLNCFLFMLAFLPVGRVTANELLEFAQASDVETKPNADGKDILTNMNEQKDPMMDEIRLKKHPKYTGSGESGEDNKKRRDEELNQSLEFLHLGNTTWRLVHRLSDYREENVTTVHENAGGLGFNQQIGLYHNLDVKGMGHIFSGDLKKTYSVSGGLESTWADDFRTKLYGEHAPVYTARALNDEIEETLGEMDVEWNFLELWRAGVKGKQSNLSDENRRTSGDLELTRYLRRRAGPRVLYRFSADNMKIDSPDYYSPHHLQQHQFGFDWPIRWEKDFRLRIAYLPGVGKESISSTQFVQTLELEIIKTWHDRWTVGLTGSADASPTYRSARSKLYFECRI